MLKDEAIHAPRPPFLDDARHLVGDVELALLLCGDLHRGRPHFLAALAVLGSALASIVIVPPAWMFALVPMYVPTVGCT